MLSYQHEYHAGNHADILKHICLSLILDSLCKKEKPFTVIDSHAGAARFNLNDERLLKTGEAESGIKKLYEYKKNEKNFLPQSVLSYLQKQEPYLEQDLYAGSVELERMSLRKGDTLFAIEKHNQASLCLQKNITLPILTNGKEKDASNNVKVLVKDSYESLFALVPPLIKRGLVLCDPSFEDASDYLQVTEALKNVRKKWNTAIIALWYPLVARRKNETAQMLTNLQDFAKTGIMPAESFRCELIVKNPASMLEEKKAHLYGSGMLVINPPWKLQEELEEAKDFLKTILSE